MPRRRKLLFVALAAPLTMFVVVVAAFLVDEHRSEHRVLRNTTLAGRAVGGLDEAHLAAVVADVAHRYATDDIDVRAPGGGFRASGAELGVQVDEAATVRAALATGRDGGAPARLAGWVRSLRRHRTSPVRVEVDEGKVHAAVAAKDPGPRTPPVEPSIQVKGNGFAVQEGKQGKGISAADVIRALPEAAASGSAVVVQVDRSDVPPRFTKHDAEVLVKRAETATATALSVSAGGMTAKIPSATLRHWVRSEPASDGLRLTVDGQKVLTDLGAALAKVAKPATQTTFVIAGGVPQPKLGTPGSACCGDAAVGLVEQALFGPPAQRSAAVALPMRPVPPKVTAADLPKLGIKQQVSTFTTNHPAGQPRVTNIHRIADIVKGQVILPGETFSVNGFVGERTVSKGFVVDHQINDEGKFDEAVGGGVSQFATTTFNAAFFAGLDFGEYQSHTIYISRYPYGREATISWQHPDLQIKNTTPYGIVLWASYTGTSLTVSMWSTPYLASVDQTNQTKTTFGPDCTRVKTERTRRYLDGRTVVDNVFSVYQPAEGVKCR